eukprot:CAMPEP_0174364420 /NCGR_PEP_ID=MMETSP0811_2-20130205/72825_1 /TAXON_ID=73025 ORGANISM="Eutreptiella gymnastica-like, Strain CCMP1594" /NCGR_SAMPLE_ID=MMETSP0811_2 /ASSEMBLY_ACC=CAM_ASM_000667 /LENGTH=181 /DNA_ID=CAMNT_0015504031 /DNA_START=105 /DNA_END=648 /DNA_ORIENTATION=+
MMIPTWVLLETQVGTKVQPILRGTGKWKGLETRILHQPPRRVSQYSKTVGEKKPAVIITISPPLAIGFLGLTAQKITMGYGWYHSCVAYALRPPALSWHADACLAWFDPPVKSIRVGIDVGWGVGSGLRLQRSGAFSQCTQTTSSAEIGESPGRLIASDPVPTSSLEHNYNKARLMLHEGK